MQSSLRIILGNQLFPVEHLPSPRGLNVFMAEDLSLCTDERHHKQKLVLFLAAMRNYADALRDAGYQIHYYRLDQEDSKSYEEKLTAVVRDHEIQQVSYFEIEDKPMERRIEDWVDAQGLEAKVEKSPMFLCERERFADYTRKSDKPLMADFYRAERQRLGLLVDSDGAPSGGRWSFDSDNRKKLPKSIEPPRIRCIGEQEHVTDVTRLIERRFPDHPGTIEVFNWPVTRRAALEWLDDFIEHRLENYGPYQDAISRKSQTVFHSLLSPVLNLGLVTPAELVERLLNGARSKDVPLASTEGIIRQIVGWREFVRGIYREHGDQQASANFWGHDRLLADSWYLGQTGLAPLDDAISNAWHHGWDHHIVRLMVVGNLMTLSGIAPQEAHRWFMEMYVDSAEWVMGPNVYGMALFSDGGLFATKPYICGSNYLLKMSDYPRGDWCDVVDGLYWRFVSKHRDFFSGHPRMAMMPALFDKLDKERKVKLFDAADRFIEQHTRQKSGGERQSANG